MSLKRIFCLKSHLFCFCWVTSKKKGEITICPFALLKTRKQGKGVNHIGNESPLVQAQVGRSRITHLMTDQTNSRETFSHGSSFSQGQNNFASIAHKTRIDGGMWRYQIARLLLQLYLENFLGLSIEKLKGTFYGPQTRFLSNGNNFVHSVNEFKSVA